MLEITYASLVDWYPQIDLLHCNQSFHHTNRRDCILVNTDLGLTPARLEYMFQCHVQNRPRCIAIVRYFKPTAVYPSDRWAGMRRFAISDQSSFIFLDTAVRGALMVPAGDRAGKEFHCNDEADGDMLLRLRVWGSDD